MTRRFGCALTLRAADVDEYRRRHDAIWPEVTAELKSQEITSSSLFVDPANDRVFGYLETEGADSADPPSDTSLAWWKFMSDLMPTGADGAPAQVRLAEAYHFE